MDEAAAARYAPEVWADLSPDLRINAIYQRCGAWILRPLSLWMTCIQPTVSIGQTRNSLSMSSLATPNGAAHGMPNVRKSIALGSLGNVESKRTPQAMGRRLLEIVVYGKGCRIGGTLTLDDLAETPSR